jgi:hypothetical protein
MRTSDDATRGPPVLLVEPPAAEMVRHAEHAGRMPSVTQARVTK